jgi:translation initiation factor 2B subunit (eIF-2B alpha/beta/delta family)
MLRKYRFNRICKNIKSLKIQGATNIAKASLKAYSLFPTQRTKRILLSLRPTEPMLSHVLSLVGEEKKEKILSHFREAQEKINLEVFSLIKNNSTIFTHCHSTNVIKSLLYSKKKGKNFRVYNTETRPIYQGRKTSKELSRGGVSVTNFIDSAAAIAIKSSDYIFLGADAILKDSVINKVGSGMFAEIARANKVPVYIVADSWKYSKKPVKLEQRDFKEVWDPKKNKIHVKNPAFESIPIRNITKIISELGILSPREFFKEVKKT